MRSLNPEAGRSRCACCRPDTCALSYATDALRTKATASACSAHGRVLWQSPADSALRTSLVLR
eukprot:3094197-Prymnesium_polylepis.1